MRQHLWRPPDGGTFKLNFEASFLKESRISYAAVLVRNNKRVFLRACTYPYGDVVDAFIAEARAYEMALIFVEEMGFCRILLEGDSHFVPRVANRAAHLLVVEGRRRKILCVWDFSPLEIVKKAIVEDWMTWVQIGC